MVKKQTQHAQSPIIETSAETIIGLDIGYGAVKAVSITGEPVIFQSVWASAREFKDQAEEIAKKHPGDQLTDDEGDWFIGDLATSQYQTRPGQIRKLRGRTADETTIGNVARLRLAKAAIGKLFPGLRNGDAVHLQIATGLPVDHMRGAADLKAALIGTHRIRTDLTDFVAHISAVRVMPQPYGTIYRNMLTPAGALNPCHTAKRTGVVDIGTYTVDLTLDNDGEYIDAASGSVEAGVFTIQETIANAYERDYGMKPPYGEVENIVRTGCFRIQNRTINYVYERDQAVEPLRDATLDLMTDKWQGGVSLDVIYVSGGGAGMIFNAIKAAYPQAELVEKAQLANAQGYLNYALYRTLKTQG